MNGREVVRRLRAFHEGRPLPRGETLHHLIASDEDLLVLAFVRMGGESRPWGVAWGNPGEKPNFLTVPEGRDRDLVGSMMAQFAPTLLSHLRCPGYTDQAPISEERLQPLRQIWLPNITHLNMLHQIAYAYTFTQWGDENRPVLNGLGRGASWLHRESQRPGQQHTIVATEALRSAFAFPAEATRQGHLGFLLAWLQNPGDRYERMRAALMAETEPVATALDPGLERTKLEPAVDRWRVANEAKDPQASRRAEEEIRRHLEIELKRRFDLTSSAIRLLRQDPRHENKGVTQLVKEAVRQQWVDHMRTERRIAGLEPGSTFVPSVETDRFPAAAGRRYLLHEASEELLYSALIHDDHDLFAEAVADGEAFEGIIASVDDEGPGRTTIPIWTVRSEGLRNTKIRTGSWVCVLGLPNRDGVVRSVEDAGDGALVFEVEIRGCKTVPRGATGKLRIPAADPLWEGERIAFCKNSAEGIARRKASKMWAQDGPGAWLTHSRPGGVLAAVDSEDRDSASVEVTA